MSSSPARGEQADRDWPLNGLPSFDVKNDPARTTRRRHVRIWPVASLSAMQRSVQSWGQSGLEIDGLIRSLLTQTGSRGDLFDHHISLSLNGRGPSVVLP